MLSFEVQPFTGNFVSQYPYPPSPYQTPGVPFGNWAPARPASTRKATIWQCALATILLLYGAGICAMAWAISTDDLQQQSDQMQQQFKQMNLPIYTPPGGSMAQMMRIGQTVEGGFIFLLGAVLLGLALLVSRGGRTAMLLSMLEMVAIGLVAVVFGLVSILMIFANPLAGLVLLIFSAFWLTLCVIPFMLLRNARRNSGNSSMTLAMQQMQYWMMMQQQQAAAAAGYGYGQPQYGGAGYGLGYGQVQPPAGMPQGVALPQGVPQGMPQIGNPQLVNPQFTPPGMPAIYPNPAPTPPAPPQAPPPPANPPAT
jgi:hypothetical protein